VRLLAADHVLVGVVEIVVADDAGGGLVALEQRETFGRNVAKKLSKIVLVHVDVVSGGVTPAFPCS
jgi:hypothetical protein